MRQVTAQQIGYLARIVLAIGIERDHCIGTGGQGVPYAAEQAAHQGLIGKGEDVELESEALGHLEWFVAYLSPWFAEDGRDKVHPTWFQRATCFVEFSQDGLDGNEAMLRNE